MTHRSRPTLIEAAPSTAFMVHSGIREKEKVLLEADGVTAQINNDGSVVIELYTPVKRIGLRISPEDAKSQAHVFKHWLNLK